MSVPTPCGEPATQQPFVARPFENGFRWVDAEGRQVLFSAGEDPVNPLAESFASALRGDELFSGLEDTECQPPLFEDDGWSDGEDHGMEGYGDDSDAQG